MQYEFLLWLRLVLPQNNICPHGNLPGAYFMQQYRNTVLAERWYNRLRALIQENLTVFPAKYPLYDVEPWSSAGIRQYVTRNDVILYSVDEIHSYVYIRSVCTRGRNLDLHLSEQSESIE